MKRTQISNEMDTLSDMVNNDLDKTQEKRIYLTIIYIFSNNSYEPHLYNQWIKTPIKSTCGHWHGGHLYGKDNSVYLL